MLPLSTQLLLLTLLHDDCMASGNLRAWESGLWVRDDDYYKVLYQFFTFVFDSHAVASLLFVHGRPKGSGVNNYFFLCG
jgi:hypothetical protein